MSEAFDTFRLSDADTAPRLLQTSRRFFDATESAFGFLGYETAAENVRRYRSGRGGLEEYSDAEIARHPALLRAEDENRTHFEARTFTGRTRNDELNAELLGLRDGGSYSFFDKWDFSVPISGPSTYLAFGRTSVTSNGAFSAHRNGDVVTIRGYVGHGFGPREKFDFNADQPGSRPAAVLEGSGEAAPFHMAYDRIQDVEAELRYEPAGSLTLRRATWGAVR
ncbi:hypothetical protein GCM10009416_00740 [Craurococcus roseus]|uniref:Uncharacterized protein n=1 Tax=Craurococcus roseus TaxID=77585 RepID=A0ABN1EJ00_9PROT